MHWVNAQDARRNGFCFDGLIDGREDDFIASHVNDDAASGEVGDDFIAAIAVLGVRQRYGDDGGEEAQTQQDWKAASASV